MQMTYDYTTDALYIQLIDNPVVRSKQINPNLSLDMDENGEIIGIEVLNARKSGIDPLKLEVLHTPTDQDVERPDPEALRKGRIARMEAVKRQRRREAQDAR